MFRPLLIALIVGGMLAGGLPTFAENPAADDLQVANPGQNDLDRATELVLTANSLADLERVIRLCRAALEKGLDEDNRAFAHQLLSSSLYRHATLLAAAIFERTPPHPQWPQIRLMALRELEQALEFGPDQGEIHLLIARLHTLPGGEREKGLAALDRAIELLGENPRQQSDALLLRAAAAGDEEKQMADLDEALRVFPENLAARRARGLAWLARREFDKALEDLGAVLEAQPEDVLALGASAEALLAQEKTEEALARLDEVIERGGVVPAAHLLRARLRAQTGDNAGALRDLDLVIEQAPQNVAALLFRARVRFAEGQRAQAKADVDRALELQPGAAEAILLRALMAADEGNFEQAIRNLELLVRAIPDNVELRTQLALFYSADGRPRKAIEMYSAALSAQEDYAPALRGRGDCYLAIGEHAKAIADYEAAYRILPEDPALLNNFAWVLATSPEEELRDGRRAVELAVAACEKTEYRRPHILSTLAAAHAETGDFEAAVRWSTKALEVAGEDVDEEMKAHLQAELESFQAKKPWRELKQTPEKPGPPPAEDSDLDLDVDVDVDVDVDEKEEGAGPGGPEAARRPAARRTGA